jgi:hypothetical protein
LRKPRPCSRSRSNAVRAGADGDNQVAFRLAAQLTKGDKGRTIRVPASLLSRLRSYIEIERAAAAEKFRMRDGIRRIPNALTCDLNAAGIRVTTPSCKHRLVRLDTVTPDERRRLAIHGRDGAPAEPAALWLSEVGLPIAPNSWEVAFSRASRRCRTIGLACDVRPH